MKSGNAACRIMWLKKIFTFTLRSMIENSRRGVGRSLESQLFERKYEPKLESRGMGRGVSSKKLSMGGEWIFSDKWARFYIFSVRNLSC